MSQAHSVRDVVRACYGHDRQPEMFRSRLLAALRRAVPFDASFFATSDPDSLLFTSTFAEEPLAAAAPLFLDNEFGAVPDVNRFADIAHAVSPVSSLDRATAGQRELSARSRQIMAPLHLGDEARVALRVDGTTWGFMCLHRSGRGGFSSQELALMAKLAPHAGGALRRLATTSPDPAKAGPPEAGPPEAVILSADGLVTAIGGAVEEIGCGPIVVGDPLPLPFAAVVHRLEAIERGSACSPSLTPDG